MSPSLLILAAGIGSRYGSLKQMDAVGPSGEALIDYSIFDAIKAGFRKAVFVISPSMEGEFKDVFAKKFQDKIEVHSVLQKIEDVPERIQVPSDREKPWGTTHAVLAAAPEIEEPFAVLNADDFYGAKSFGIIFSCLTSLSMGDEATYFIVGYRLSKTLSEYGYVSRAVCEVDEEGYLKSIIERMHISKTRESMGYRDEKGSLIQIQGDPVVSMNMMGFTPSVFTHFEFYFEKFMREHSQNLKAELYLPNVVNEIIRAHNARVKVLVTGENWFGITYKEDRASVKEKIMELVKEGLYPENLWKGS